MKRILVIAGSDSSGGAGLEADQKVIAANKCYAMTATTALTAQNTHSVYDIHETPSAFVRKQIDACVEDIGVDVVKTGMLASASTISVVAGVLQKHHVPLVVVDPVMVSTSGSQLLPEEAVKTLCRELLPLTTILTPNIPEANLLLREAGGEAIDVQNLDDMKQLAIAVHNLGPQYVLIKGGHIPLTADRTLARTDEERKLVCNVLYGPNTAAVIEFPYSQSRNTHGTGCSLASAIACRAAQDSDIVRAVRTACQYVDAGIKMSQDLGKGHGPINHFHSVQVLPFSPGNFMEYLLYREDVRQPWHNYTHHKFVERLGDGTLPIENFKNYMVQDYLYLIQFARANALAGYKAKTLDDVTAAARIVMHIRHETNMHIAECEQLGITEEVLKNSEEHQACTAYSRYVLDIGQSEDWLALQVSLLPCLLGYGLIAQRLSGLQRTDSSSAERNRYSTWINNYTAEDYTSAVEKGCALIESHVTKQSPSRIEELVKIFIHATKMEAGFWDMAGKT